MTTVMGKLRAPDLPEVAPDFSLKTLDGKVVRLSDFRGKKVVLNFWATWCAPCRVEIPLINSFVDANDDVIVLGIATDGRNKALAEHVEKLGITYPVLRGTNTATTVFVDEDGHIDGAHVGIITQFQLWWGTL
ncbi:MAG: TlpA family protein disulfide reductase [Deltaproteobacteria bacterium]|nr:TlpA family protein disulfide reductase [Deltaproteobacteria bacterium]